MKISSRPNSQFTRSDATGSYARQSRGPDESERIDLGEWLANLWEDRYLILGSMILLLALGGFYIWRSTPTYLAEAMLQIQPKKVGASDAAFVKMENLFSEPTEAQAEIEMLKSNQVLGRTVQILGLDLVAQPRLTPVVGAALVRGKPDAPRIEIGSFELPDQFRGQKFLLTYLGKGNFRWNAPDGSALAQGKPGEVVHATYDGASLKLHVRMIVAKPGQVFLLMLKPMQTAIADLRLVFDAYEKGKLTNVLGLTLKDSSPFKAADVLNEIVNQYIKQKIEMKAGEASKTLTILQAKMPLLKTQLDAAENRLNQFRARSGSVDLTREADLVLLQNSSLNAQISSLKQKREELLRTYRDNSDVVTTLNQQIAKLQSESSQAETSIRSLPAKQQEVVRLSREVQVNTDLYTALLNNIQQLQITSAGEIGNVAVVDPARPNLEPIGAKPSIQMALFGFLGLFVSGGLMMVRRGLRRGVKDHRLIESKLGLPVMVTIPHSKVQEKHSHAIGKRSEGLHLLAEATSDDLATESLRSLRTMLHFSMKDARNSIIMVTGPSPSIGKSFVSSNLATVLAQAGASVLLVDGDLRKGNLHSYFGLKNRMGGLSEVLSGRSNWKTNVHKTEIVGLDLMSTGVIPPDPSELLMTARFSEFVTEISEAYDFVIIDVPPLLAVTDATIIGSLAGTVLLVAKYGQHSLDELRTCQRRLESNGIHLNGCVFNDVEQIGLGYGYSNYRYAYHYKYK